MKGQIKSLTRIAIAAGLGTAIILGVASMAHSQSPVINFVTAGGSDLDDPDIDGSGPGFDKNYSLVAFKFADGTATGKLVDRNVGVGGQGLRADIDCVHVVGNIAWVSGIITQGHFLNANGERVDTVGWYVRTRVQDNGANNDPDNPDRIAFSEIRRSAPFVCSNMFQSTFWDMPAGQVKVR